MGKLSTVRSAIWESRWKKLQHNEVLFVKTPLGEEGVCRDAKTASIR